MTPRKQTILWLCLSLLSAAGMVYYVSNIWSANQPSNFSDFYAPWWASHELLLHGRNPYSPAVAHEIQTVIYGAPINPSADDPAAIGGGFAYPPYTVLLIWPVVHLSFASASQAFRFASILGTLLSLDLWMRSLRLRPSLLRRFTIAVFVLGSFPALQALKLENLSVLAAALLTAAIFLLCSGRLITAGIVLALATFKPQFTIALILWLILWTASDWRRRRPLAFAFLGSMLSLGLISQCLVPGWLISFLNVLKAYRHYTYGHSILDVWLTPRFGLAASLALLAAALALLSRYRSVAANSDCFASTVSLLLAANVVIIPTLAPHAQLLLLPGFLTLLSPSPLGRLAHSLRFAAWSVLAFPWVAASALPISSLWLPVNSLLRFWEFPLATSPILPVVLFLALAFRLPSVSCSPGPSIPASSHR